MSFVNPLDLFGISPQEPAPDSTTLRKARRAKLLEFDLADEDVIFHEEIPITRADFLKACEEIEEPGKLAVYRGLQRLPGLQQFLLHGSLAFFDEAPPSWVYHPQFLEGIAPYYAERFAPALAQAVREGDRGTVRRLVSRAPVAPESFHPRLYGDAERVVADQADRLADLTSSLESAQAPDVSPARAASGIVDVRLLEDLPAYFEGARSKVGQAARLLAVTAFNELDDVDAAAAILRSISELSVNAVTADRIHQDLEQIESIRERRQLSERHAPTLEAAAAALVRLRTLKETAEAGPFDTSGLAGEVGALVDIDDLNKLPEELAELRDHVALSLRALALACWNKHYEADVAVAVTKIALRIKAEDDVHQLLQTDLETLSSLGREASAKAAEEGRVLLNLLRKVESDTNVGFFGPTVDWAAVERFLDDLFDKGGDQLLRVLKDEALKSRIRSTLYSILNRLGRHRASGASRIRARVQPALAASTSARSTPDPSRSSRSPATSKGRPASSTSGGRPSTRSSSAAPSAATGTTKSSDEGSVVPYLVGIFAIFAFILLVVAANNGRSSQPLQPPPTPPPVAIGPSMDVTVVAANGKLSPVRIKVDDDVRRPYWVELGEEVTLTVTDSAFVEQELDDLTISVDGKPYPTDYRDSRGRVVITRESARAVLNGRNPTAPSPPRTVASEGLQLAELAGNWAGDLSRPGEVWGIELNIRLGNSGTITGSSMKFRNGNAVMWSIKGMYHRGELRIEEVEVLDERRIQGAIAPWCSREGTLQARRNGSDLVLEGPMHDPSGRCPLSRLRVVRSSATVNASKLSDTDRWRGNQLGTGDSPYNAHFGSGVYSSYDENEITFRNGPGSDVVICLVDLYSDRVIRNEYIRAGDTFTMTEVPSGTYFIRGVYGRDWNPNLDVLGGRVTGGFETDASYSQSRQDPLRLVDDGYSATAYDVTLYTVSNGNMESTGINASSFFD